MDGQIKKIVKIKTNRRKTKVYQKNVRKIIKLIKESDITFRNMVE